MLFRRIVRRHAEGAQHRRDRIDILQCRHIIQYAPAVRAEERPRNNGKHCILRPTDLHAAMQRMSPVNDQLFHSPLSSSAYFSTFNAAWITFSITYGA